MKAHSLDYKIRNKNIILVKILKIKIKIKTNKNTVYYTMF